MRITYRVFLVGCIPITIAAAIALAALLLLGEAERARNGAVLAGTIYRNLLAARTARDDFVEAARSDRSVNYELFLSFGSQARFDLQRLGRVVRDPAHAAAAKEATEALTLYLEDMRSVLDVTIRNDGLIATMGNRANLLVKLTDDARARQHESNSDIIASLAERDRKLRVARDIVDRAQDLSAALSQLVLADLSAARSEGAGAASTEAALDFERARMRSSATALSQALAAAGLAQAVSDLGRLVATYGTQPSVLQQGDASIGGAGGNNAARGALGAWVDRLLKVHSTAQRALHEDVAELLAYSVRASETEQATQNVAIEVLKLSNRTGSALSTRDARAAQSSYESSQTLADTVASLPISPLIQTEMIDAVEKWRSGLLTTINGLKEQNSLLRKMDQTANRMIDDSRFLDDMLTRNADRIGDLVRNILFLGAAIGLLIGSISGLVVAHSITRPLKRLQQRMMELANESHPGPIAGFDRRDELGDMARATNVFITEIGRREKALRKSKSRADTALAELQKTQTDLIQAEKLASLGQLVAGVAHEINTPLGIALTTSTLLGEETRQFSESAASGKLQRSALDRFVARMREGTGLLFSNLTRAADLVHSFKQVAADQASGERRKFEVSEWLQDLLTSLSPVLRKSKHEVATECPPGIVIDTYPGALGQILTNLLTNAVVHAYGDGQAGRLWIRVTEPRSDTLRIVFSDDGKGIPPENIGKVFDPFFTTGRSRGSTGLGLHIVYNLVTSMLQGRINVYSKVDKGTRFTIDIPKSVGEGAVETPIQGARSRREPENAV